MTNILVYDDDEQRLEEVAEAADVTIAEVISALMDYLDELEV